ncbi:MAG: LysM peptidoglycan-binding domain-containing protein [Gemmatimonas sp.]
MRSEQAHVSTIEPSAAQMLLVRVVVAVVATLALLLLWHPVVLRGQESPTAPAATTGADTVQPPKSQAAKAPTKQDTASSTHVVKAGETLWSIATRYYGDGHQWRAVARRNGIALSSESALRIGTKLVMPSRRDAASVVSAVSALPAASDTTTPKVATTPALPPLPAPVTTGPVVVARPSGALSAQTAGKSNAPATATRRAATAAKAASVEMPKNIAAAQDTTSMTPLIGLRPQVKAERLLTSTPARIGLVDAADLRLARPAGESPTVFLLRVPDAGIAAASAQAVLQHAEVAPRHGEYAAAPFPIADGRWVQAGSVVRRLDDAGSTLPASTRMQLADQLEIRAPASATLAVGTRLIVVKNGGQYAPGVAVGVPTGVLQVTKVDAGRVHAYVRSITGVIEQGDALFPIEGSAADVGGHPERVTGSDVETTVAWIDAGELLPTLQSYVVLAAGQSQGVKAGEQFALVRRGAAGAEERIAVVRVVRVDATGSSAIVIAQSLPDIASGVRARRITRLP